MPVRWKLVLLRAEGEIQWFVKDLGQREPGRVTSMDVVSSAAEMTDGRIH